MSEARELKVEVFDGENPVSCGCGCSGGCGGPTGEALEKRVAEVKEKLRADYGETVAIDYVDTHKTGLDNYPLVARVIKAGYSFPITLVNGEPRLAGDLVYEDIKAVIEEEMNA